MTATSQAMLVAYLSLGVALATGGCGGHVDEPTAVPDSAADGAVDVVDSADAPLISPACQDDAGNCIAECLTWLFYEDKGRSCYERAVLCVPAPLPNDGGECGTAGCFVNLADGAIISTCSTPSANRWRRCTADEFASVEPIWQECPLSPVDHAGEVFF